MLSSVAFLFLSSYNQRLTYYIMFLECVCIGLGYTWCMRYVELGCRKCFAVLFLLLNVTFIMWVTEVRSPEISRYLCTQWLLYGHFRGLELRGSPYTFTTFVNMIQWDCQESKLVNFWLT